MIIGSTDQSDKTVINIHIPQNKASTYMKQKFLELKGKRNNSMIIFGNFNTPLSIIDKIIRNFTKDI